MDDMKHCRGCDRDLPRSDFNTNKAKRDGLQTQCRECNNRASARHYQANSDDYKSRRNERRKRNREIIQEAKTVPCHDCGRAFPYFVMDLDHRDPSNKSFGMGESSAFSMSESRLRAEIAKCDPVCANCHRFRTHMPR